MSTRANIFVDYLGERKQFYHHYDGYPDGVGSELVEYLTKAQEGTTETEKVFSNFMKIIKSDELYEEEDEVNIHGDIEYLYYVHIGEDGNSISYTNLNTLSNEFQVKQLEEAKFGKTFLTD